MMPGQPRSWAGVSAVGWGVVAGSSGCRRGQALGAGAGAAGLGTGLGTALTGLGTGAAGLGTGLGTALTGLGTGLGCGGAADGVDLGCDRPVRGACCGWCELLARTPLVTATVPSTAAPAEAITIRVACRPRIFLRPGGRPGPAGRSGWPNCICSSSCGPSGIAARSGVCTGKYGPPGQKLRRRGRNLPCQPAVYA